MFPVFAVLTVLFIDLLASYISRWSTQQTVEGRKDSPLETSNVSQFAFAAFSRVAAGHKVNSSWGEGACNDKESEP